MSILLIANLSSCFNKKDVVPLFEIINDIKMKMIIDKGKLYLICNKMSGRKPKKIFLQEESKDTIKAQLKKLDKPMGGRLSDMGFEMFEK